MKTTQALVGILLGITALIFVAGYIAPAQAAEPEVTMWTELGIKPFASSTDEGCKRAPEAINGFDQMPADVREEFLKKLGPTCSNFIEAVIRTGTVFAQMWEGGPKLMSNVKLAEIPVNAMNGRQLRTGSVVAVPKAYWWSFDKDGKRYWLALPLVCANWAWYVVDLPRAAAPPQVAAAVPAREFSPGPVGQCSQGYQIVAHLWDLTKIKNATTRRQAEALIAAAIRRESDRANRREAYTPDVGAFSRTMGGKLRTEESQAHAAVDTTVRVRLLDDASLVPVSELEPLVLVAGRSLPVTLSAAQKTKIVETIWTDVDSPAVSGGASRLRMFASEWTDCQMNLHGAINSEAARAARAGKAGTAASAPSAL